MHLHRVTPDPFKTSPKYLGGSAENYKATIYRIDGEPDVEVVKTRFARFGGGQYRHSDFEVYVEWQDVEKIIEKFCEAKHPEAMAVQTARKLAATVKGLGWREPGA
jgi:hypothetical protein